MSEKSSSATTRRRSSSRSQTNRSSSSTLKKSLVKSNLSSLLKANVPRLSSPMTQKELESLQIKPRNVANVALQNNSQNFIDLFLTHEKVQQASQKMLEYNERVSQPLSFEFLLIRLKDEYFYFYIEDNEPKIISLNTRKAESKFVVVLDKLNNLIKTSGFRICSSVISKEYIQECLKESEYFVIAFGIHKRHTKLKNKLSRETPAKKLSNIVAYDCLGFAFLDRYKKSKESIYLKAICSNKSFGDKILKFTELLAEFMLFKKMYLSAVDTALPYYISRKYEIIINRKSGKNFKYIVDPSDRKTIQKPIPGSKELYGYQGSLMYRSSKSKTQTQRNSSTAKTTTNSTVRRSSRTRKRTSNTNGPKQYVLQNVSFDSDSNINMTKELNELIEEE